MKISTKGRYGLKALINLAMNDKQENITIKTLCENLNISERYLEQIFSSLKKSGLVQSVVGRKGSQGGYYISKDITTLTVGEILRVLEGELEVVDNSKNKDEIDELDTFINENLWNVLNKKINNFFDSITLEDLVNQYNESKSNILYYI